MGQYTPCGEIESFPELKSPLKSLEYKAVIAHALALGFEHAFSQEEGAASRDYIPAFLR